MDKSIIISDSRLLLITVAVNSSSQSGGAIAKQSVSFINVLINLGSGVRVMVFNATFNNISVIYKDIYCGGQFY